MKRTPWLILLLICFSTLALAAPLEVTPLESVLHFPEGAGAEDAVFTMSVSLPSVAETMPGDEAINAFYAYQISDLLLFTAPMYFSEVERSNATGTLAIDYEVTYNGDHYFSVLMYKTQHIGEDSYTTQAGNVFTREVEGGSVVTMAELLGISDHLDDDGKTYERATRRANDLVYKAVFEHLNTLIDADGTPFTIGMEDLIAEFYPESDFYLTDSDTIVFFIDAGLFSYDAERFVTVPLSLAQLKDDL